MEQKTALTIVNVFAVLSFIGAGLAIIGGLLMLVAGAAVGSAAKSGGTFIALFGAAAAFMMIIAGVIGIVIGVGLWKHKTWARIVLIVFTVLGILSGLGALAYAAAYGIIYLIIDGVILWLFAFQKDVKAVFS